MTEDEEKMMEDQIKKTVEASTPNTAVIVLTITQPADGDKTTFAFRMKQMGGKKLTLLEVMGALEIAKMKSLADNEVDGTEEDGES